jgi:hypothetical protein
MMTVIDCSSSGEYSDDSEQESEEIRSPKRGRKRNPHISAQDLYKLSWDIFLRQIYGDVMMRSAKICKGSRSI